MFEESFVKSLLNPIEQLLAFDASHPRWTELPFRIWSIFILIAVCGSMIYGASLVPIFAVQHLWQSALLLTLSAGLAWSLFGPALVLISRINPFTCAHACLVTMAYGEAVLIFGACLNWSGLTAHSFLIFDRAVFNILWIGLSNIIMAIALCVQMRALRIPYWKTLAMWVIVLNGSGLIIFILLKQLMQVSFLC